MEKKCVELNWSNVEYEGSVCGLRGQTGRAIDSVELQGSSIHCLSIIKYNLYYTSIVLKRNKIQYGGS